jgi:hypothetical protein
MSFSCTQAASSHPNSRTDASFSQDYSFGISGSGSAISLAGLSHTSASSLSVTVSPTLGTLPTVTSSVILADNHNPTALRFSRAGENDNNEYESGNNNIYSTHCDAEVSTDTLASCNNDNVNASDYENELCIIFSSSATPIINRHTTGMARCSS